MEMDWYLCLMGMYHYGSCHIFPSLHHRCTQAQLLTDTGEGRVSALITFGSSATLHLEVISGRGTPCSSLIFEMTALDCEEAEDNVRAF